MPARILFIGDPHFQVSNIPEVDMFIEKLEKLAIKEKPDLICVGGDLLHTHERLHTTALNKAYEFIEKLRQISLTYVLVGNHDMCNNSQFLTTNHWMNGMKEWDNIVIVDEVKCLEIKGELFTFCPYVFPGRFEEALNTIGDKWKDSSIIFAHQEFAGCKMGAIVSVEGDKWSLTYPEVISGHIHSRQMPQSNIYYSGSALQHAFGESEKNIIPIITTNGKSVRYDLNEVDLELPRKKIVYMDVATIDEYVPPVSGDKIKVTLSGSYDEFKVFKKTSKYKDLIDKGLKVVFKPKKNKKEDSVDNTILEDTNFRDVLYEIISAEKDTSLYEIYELVVNNKKIDEGDIMFL